MEKEYYEDQVSEARKWRLLLDKNEGKGASRSDFHRWFSNQNFAPYHCDEVRAQIENIAQRAWLACVSSSQLKSVAELAAENPNLMEYLQSFEKRLTVMSEHYSVLRAELVEREAINLYGMYQAAACGKDMDTCRIIANAKLRGKCLTCNGRGEIGGQFPDGSYQTDVCSTCDGFGFVDIPEI